MTEINNDQELVKEFISGNQSAFNRLAKRYQEKIYGHARRMTGNHLDADEIVQQVLLVMYKKLKNFNFDSARSLSRKIISAVPATVAAMPIPVSRLSLSIISLPCNSTILLC